MTAATTQINARIKTDLKIKGDKGLLAAGINPSQAIRGIWELAAKYKDAPEKLKSVLFPDEAHDKNNKKLQQRRKQLKLIEDGSLIYEDFCKSLGLKNQSVTADLTYDELKESAYTQKYSEDMGWK